MFWKPLLAPQKRLKRMLLRLQGFNIHRKALRCPTESSAREEKGKEDCRSDVDPLKNEISIEGNNRDSNTDQEQRQEVQGKLETEKMCVQVKVIKAVRPDRYG